MLRLVYVPLPKNTVMKGILVIISAILCVPTIVSAQGSATASYPDQWAIITKQGGEISSQATKNTEKMGAIVAEQHTAAQMLSQLEKWNKEYNEYLKDPQGLAGSIRLGSTLYTEGTILLENIFLLKKAIEANPEGIAASVPMNNLYMETATLAVKCYRTLKEVISNGGPDHMMNGAERVETLWKLASQMRELNSKIRQTSVSIAYYQLVDVWYEATAGMINYDHKDIAKRCLKDWSRAARVGRVFSE